MEWKYKVWYVVCDVMNCKCSDNKSFAADAESLTLSLVTCRRMEISIYFLLLHAFSFLWSRSAKHTGQSIKCVPVLAQSGAGRFRGRTGLHWRSTADLELVSHNAPAPKWCSSSSRRQLAQPGSHILGPCREVRIPQQCSYICWSPCMSDRVIQGC